VPRIPLAQMAQRAGTRRRVVAFRPIRVTKSQAEELAAINRRALKPWEDARERIVEAYAAELARVIQTDSIDDLAQLFEDIAEMVQAVVLELTPNMRDWALKVERWHRDKWRGSVLAGANVDLQYLIGPAEAQEQISTFLARNTALVRDTTAQAQGRIVDAVWRGLQSRTPARKVGKEIAEALGMGRKRANRIAADQANKLGAALDGQRQREAGLDVFKYHHSGKLHPRSWHKARDGKFYDRDTGREVVFTNAGQQWGEDKIADDDMPGVPPFCACATAGVLVIDGVVI
jgi:uncharacterized protein with gpF-like domain